MKTIAFINVYFGKFPVWFPAFLKSCEYQEGIDFFFFTNCERPDWYPNNVKFIPFDEEKLKSLSLEKTGFAFNLTNYYKLCDLKPMLGHWFSEYIEEYDYWGHCDVDVIWGNLRKYINPLVEQDFDVIKGQKTRVTGHCALFKNNNDVCTHYLKNPHLKEVCSKDLYCCFDESIMNVFWKDSKEFSIDESQFPFNFYARDQPFSYQDGRIPPSFNQFFFSKGSLFEMKHKKIQSEMMYLHFRNWKNKINKCPSFNTTQNSMYVSVTAISENSLDLIDILLGYLRVVKIVLLKRYNK